VFVEQGCLVDVVGDRFDRGQQSHCLDGVVARSEEVDHVPLWSRAWCPLQQDDLAAELRDSVGQCQTGDPGTADRDFHVCSS
jgi:hypothetical protein